MAISDFNVSQNEIHSPHPGMRVFVTPRAYLHAFLYEVQLEDVLTEIWRLRGEEFLRGLAESEDTVGSSIAGHFGLIVRNWEGQLQAFLTDGS